MHRLDRLNFLAELRMAARTTWMSSVLLVGLSGCLGGGQADLLQARLREQQQQLAETQAQLRSKDKELKLARKDAEGLRVQLARSGNSGLLPEQSDLLVRVSALRINSMLTAGFDRDDAFGDDSLAIHFVPVDDQGEVVRLLGDIEIKVLDPSLPEASQTVAKWAFTAEESREHWVRGFLGTGYQFTLPWKDPPQNPELVVHVQLKPADGRTFQTSHVVKITPPVIADAVPPTTAFEIEQTSGVESRKPATSRPPVDDSSSWMKDDVPQYR